MEILQLFINSKLFHYYNCKFILYSLRIINLFYYFDLFDFNFKKLYLKKHLYY